MFVVTKKATAGLEKDKCASSCNYKVKVFIDESQARQWIDEDIVEFGKFLKERSCLDYRVVHDYDGTGLWSPEEDHNIQCRNVWFADVGEESRCSAEYLKRNAKYWTVLSYSWYEVDYESEMIRRAAGVMPSHVADDPRW